MEEIASWGIRRPGYPADERAETLVEERFAELGLERVRREPFETPFWRDRSARLRVHAGSTFVDVPCSAVPFGEPGLVTGELVRYDPSDPGAVRGRIALYDLELVELPPAFPVASRRNTPLVDPGVAGPVEAAGWAYDPDGTFGHEIHTLPFAPEIQNVMEAAVGAGAVAFVGALRNYPGGGCSYYVPYDGEPRPIPGVYVGAADAARLDAMLGGGQVPAMVQVEAERSRVVTHNVVGELAGADEEWVVIGTHHDGPWRSAVEDASGVALVLAQAEAWAAVPPDQRPHRLVFTANGAHMAGGRGTQAFIDAHRADLDRIVLEVHLEHAAADCVERGGDLEVLDRPVPRWWFTSENPWLERTVWDALVAEGADRSLVVTPTALGPRPTTDGGHFHAEGVPLVNYLAAPWYLFDAADLPDKIHAPSLRQVTRAAFRIVAATAGVSAAAVRDGVRTRLVSD